jgi:hypothetical protein
MTEHHLSHRFVVGKPAADAGRRIKCTLSDDQFGAMHWAARRSYGSRGLSMPLAEFMRQAILREISRVAAATVARGGDVPMNVAIVLDRGRVGN